MREQVNLKNEIDSFHEDTKPKKQKKRNKSTDL